MLLSNEKRRIGIIGLGSVGKAVKHALSFYYPDTVGYDIDGRGSFKEILETDVVFICVSTPGTKDGMLDCSQVCDVLSKLSLNYYSGICVIKSTVNIGFTDEAQAKFSTLRLVYMPEFLREKSNFTWFVCPDRLVISGTESDCNEVLGIFSWVDGINESVPVLMMSHKEAEIAKLAHNARIAVLVSFTNEIEEICNEYNVNPVTVMSVIHADRRVKSTEHLKPGLGAYGGKCVPKDTRALIASAKNAELLTAAERVNNRLLEE